MPKYIYKKKRGKKVPYSSISYTTGSVDLNIGRFNQAMGTDGCVGEGGNAVGNGLTESKRYVRRYYIRPQNIFCSNKAEIIKTLIDIGDSNCSVYTLNNLGDDKDVAKLMNNDIIYYYDDGILYDKNKVKVMDYDLSIKKEEKRKHFANIDKASNKAFKDAYEDRMTDATELEEDFGLSSLNFTCKELEAALLEFGHIELGNSFSDEDACSYSWEISKEGNEIVVVGWGYNIYTEEDGIENSSYFDSVEEAYEYLEAIAKSDSSAELTLPASLDEAFNLDFDNYNVYGEKLIESKQNNCCICGELLDGYGNNPEPYMSADKGQCCDGCNLKFVIPLRSEIMFGE